MTTYISDVLEFLKHATSTAAVQKGWRHLKDIERLQTYLFNIKVDILSMNRFKCLIVHSWFLTSPV